MSDAQPCLFSGALQKLSAGAESDCVAAEAVGGRNFSRGFAAFLNSLPRA